MNFNLDETAEALLERSAINFQKVAALLLCSGEKCFTGTERERSSHLDGPKRTVFIYYYVGKSSKNIQLLWWFPIPLLPKVRLYDRFGGRKKRLLAV